MASQSATRSLGPVTRRLTGMVPTTVRPSPMPANIRVRARVTAKNSESITSESRRGAQSGRRSGPGLSCRPHCPGSSCLVLVTARALQVSLARRGWLCQLSLSQRLALAGRRRGWSNGFRVPYSNLLVSSWYDS